MSWYLSYTTESETMNTIGNQMRAARKRAGLTVRQIGYEVNAGESQISTWETGKVDPKADARAAYVKAGYMTAEQALAPFVRTERWAHLHPKVAS